MLKLDFIYKYLYKNNISDEQSICILNSENLDFIEGLFSLHHVSENIIEEYIYLYDDNVWNALLCFQDLSEEFIIKNIDVIFFITKNFNLASNILLDGLFSEKFSKKNIFKNKKFKSLSSSLSDKNHVEDEILINFNQAGYYEYDEIYILRTDLINKKIKKLIKYNVLELCCQLPTNSFVGLSGDRQRKS